MAARLKSRIGSRLRPAKGHSGCHACLTLALSSRKAASKHEGCLFPGECWLQCVCVIVSGSLSGC